MYYREASKLKRKIKFASPCFLFLFLLGFHPIAFTQTPIGHWTFEPNEELTDKTGNFDALELKGSHISNGFLHIDSAAFALAKSYAGPDVNTNKTLVLWLTLNELKASGGTPVTLATQTQGFLDGIVYSVSNKQKWQVNSDYWHRSGPIIPGYAEDKVGIPIKIALVYRQFSKDSVQVSMYRNDELIGSYATFNRYTYYTGNLRVYFGGETSWINCKIDEARLYDVALSAEELTELEVVKKIPALASSFWVYAGIGGGIFLLFISILLYKVFKKRPKLQLE